MGSGIDFIEWLETDMSMNVMMCLDDPSDLIRASSVSRFWRHFVITNGLCKQLCVRIFPQLTSITDIKERFCRTKRSGDVGCSKSTEWEKLVQDHHVFSSLCRAFTAFKVSVCSVDAVSASSTDDYPRESVANTVGPGDTYEGQRFSYWSSKGQKDPDVPETLIYKLHDDFCVVTEINIRPFQAFFQTGQPIYSAKSVRFRMGHPKCPKDMERDIQDFPLEQQLADDKFVWTYTSQEFPMAQVNELQKFKLPEPVICMGGFLQIELLGRVQTQEMDDLFYICVCHVQVLGRSLHPAFCVDALDPICGKFRLKYDPDAFECRLQQDQGIDDSLTNRASEPLDFPQVEEGMRGQLEDLLGLLIHGIDPGIDYVNWGEAGDHGEGIHPFDWDEDDDHPL